MGADDDAQYNIPLQLEALLLPALEISRGAQNSASYSYTVAVRAPIKNAASHEGKFSQDSEIYYLSQYVETSEIKEHRTFLKLAIVITVEFEVVVLSLRKCTESTGDRTTTACGSAVERPVERPVGRATEGSDLKNCNARTYSVVLAAREGPRSNSRLLCVY
eukprot:IDg6473t1